MSALLAIDTADRTAGVALLAEGQVVAEYMEASAYRHSERLFALVDQALRGAGLGRGDLSGIAVTTGPGSFTGLRVGLATAKGLAYSLEVPLVGVSTLEAMARGAMPFRGIVLPMLDARKRQVYAAGFDGRDGSEVLSPQAIFPEELAAQIGQSEGDLLAVGSGLGPYRELFKAVFGERLLCIEKIRWGIPPAQVAMLGASFLLEGKGQSPEAVSPIYLRKSEAEETRGRRPR